MYDRSRFMGQSRALIVAVVITLSLLVPAAICLAVVFLEAGSPASLAAVMFASIVWMALLLLVNWWEFGGLWLRGFWLVAFTAAVFIRLVSRPIESSNGGTTWTSAALGLVGAAGAWLLARAIAARRHSGPAVDLMPPFASGRFLVTDGGDGQRSFLVNYHYGFGQHRRSGASRSMRYAMDVVEVGPAGMSARGFVPRRNEAFLIWQRPLLSPCTGVVAHVENGIEDNTAFGPHRPYGVGNHVVIRTAGDVYGTLGHLKRGSVCVKAGDPVPIHFFGRFPVRNQTFRVN